MGWKLWLDDDLHHPDAIERHTPPDFLGAASTTEAKALVRKFGWPEFMDLDHDLGMIDGVEDSAMIFVKWLYSQNPDRPPPEWRIHSRNSGGGAANLESYLSSWKKIVG